MKQRIHVYAICWNEKRMLPYFLRHYGKFAERIVIYDNDSDDGSQEIVKAHPKAELRHFHTCGWSREDTEVLTKETVWQESRGIADWVITCDIDEFIYHQNLEEYLNGCRERGINMPVPTGFQMVSDSFPTTGGQIYEEVRNGFFDRKFNKQILFNPAEIHGMNYSPGCHYATPIGKIHSEFGHKLKLLHFKFLGFDYLSTRYKELGDRKSDYDKRHGYGANYFLSEEKLREKFGWYKEKSHYVWV